MVKSDKELISDAKRKINMLEKRGLINPIQRSTILKMVNSKVVANVG